MGFISTTLCGMLSNMLKIGLTGNFGSGKSTAAQMFQTLGAVMIDVDHLAHEILKKDLKVKRNIIKVFGTGILENGDIHRATLAKLVFNDQHALYLLENIVHPAVTKRLKALLKTYQKQKIEVVVVDAAILIESGWNCLVDKMILIKTKKDLQIKRAMLRTKLSKKDVLKRLSCQMSVTTKKKYADIVLDNSGTKSNLYKKIKAIWKNLYQLTSAGRESCNRAIKQQRGKRV